MAYPPYYKRMLGSRGWPMLARKGKKINAIAFGKLTERGRGQVCCDRRGAPALGFQNRSRPKIQISGGYSLAPIDANTSADTVLLLKRFECPGGFRRMRGRACLLASCFDCLQFWPAQLRFRFPYLPFLKNRRKVQKKSFPPYLRRYHALSHASWARAPWCSFLPNYGSRMATRCHSSD